MPKSIDFILAVARKLLSKRGKGIASIANRSDVEAKAGEITAIFQQSGLPINRLDEFIKSEKDVTKYLNLIEESAKSKVKKSIQPKPLIKSQKPADVFDLKGKKIKNTDNIMGGEEIGLGKIDLPEIPKPKKLDPALYEDRGGNIIPAQFKDATKETEEQILARLQKGNKESISNIKYKNAIKAEEAKAAADENYIMKVFDPEDFSDGGRAGYYGGGPAMVGEDLSEIGHGSDSLMARNMQLAPNGQATTSTGLNYLLGQDNDTVRVPYKDGLTARQLKRQDTENLASKVKEFIDMQASGSKSGKNQIMGASEGITADNETFNAIIKMDIPIFKKIDLLGSYGYGKGRTRIEDKDQEIFLDEGGYKDRNLGLGFDSGAGTTASAIKNLETGDNEFRFDIKKSIDFNKLFNKAEGGRIGYNEGNMVLPKPKPKNFSRTLNMLNTKAAANTLDTKTYANLVGEFAKKAFDNGELSEVEYMRIIKPLFGEVGEMVTNQIQDDQNYLEKYAGGGLAGLLGEGPSSMDQEPRTNYKEAGVVDKIGGMVNYKNVPYYVNSAAKGATNIAEFFGKLPFAATELASDMIQKPLFKTPKDYERKLNYQGIVDDMEVPGVFDGGSKFVGGEMFEKFGDNIETGALAEKLGLASLVEEGGKKVSPEARTVGGLLELGGEFANMGGILAAGKNLFKGGDSLKKLSQSMGKVKEGKTLEKLVDETLTARGEGRRDFNKLVASGGLMVALKSIGLGGIKAAKTKSTPDAFITLKTLIDDSDEMTEDGPRAIGRLSSSIDVSGLTDAVKKSLAVIMKNSRTKFGEKVVRNKVKGKDGKFTDDYEDISTEEAAYIMEELQKRGHNVKFEHYDDMGGQGVDDILDKFKNHDLYKGTKLGKENYDKFSKKVAKMTDKEKIAYHTSITDDTGQYYDEFVEELLDMNFKNSTK